MSTHEQPLSAAEIVKTLGGATALARRPELVSQRSAIANWSKDGIPARHWPALARIAATIDGAGHITIEVLERHIHAPAEKADA